MVLMPSAPRKHTHRQRRIKQHKITDKVRELSNTFKGIDSNGKEYTVHKDPRKTARWQRVRLIVLNKFPLCYDPFDHHDKYGEAEPSTDVHHIKQIRLHHHLAFVESNLVGLCNRCHQKVDALEFKNVDTLHLFNWAVRDEE